MKNAFKAVLFLVMLMLSAVMVTANPVVTAIGDQTVNEGSALKIALASTASLGAQANFSICQTTTQPGACSGEYNNKSITVGSTAVNISTLGATTGELNWTPDFTQSGTFFFNITANVSTSPVSALASSKAFKVTVVDVPPKLTVTAPTFGGENQERSNPNHDTEDRRETNITGTITVKNDGSEAMTALQGTVTVASGFTVSDLKVNFTLPKTTLAVGESISVPVTIRAPQKLNAVNSALKAEAVNVATLAFTATPAVAGGTVTGSAQLPLRAENNLRIKDVKVRYDDKSDSVDDRDTIDKLKPGMNVEFEVEIENRFKNKEDVTIEDIEVTVTSDSEIDIDESEDVGDLAAEDTDVITFTTVIDENADDGSFNVGITAEGTDEFGARHGEKWTIDFKIERKSHEIEIAHITLAPPTVTCEEETRLTADLKNIGRRDESDVVVRVASPELSFGTVSDTFQLDENDEDTVAFIIPVPQGTKAGNYRVNVETYYNTDVKSNTETAILAVAACTPATAQPETPATGTPSNGVTVVTVPPAQQSAVNETATPAKKSFFETRGYIALLALGYVAVIGGGIALVLNLLKKP